MKRGWSVGVSLGFIGNPRPFMGQNGIQWTGVDYLGIEIERIRFPDGGVGIPDGAGNLRGTALNGDVKTIPVSSLPN